MNGLAGADAFFARLAEDPTYPRKLKGADEAMSRVLAMTTQDAARFSALGESFKEQAYAMQKTSWGKAKIPPSSTRLSEAESFARSRSSAVAPALASVTDKGVTAEPFKRQRRLEARMGQGCRPRTHDRAQRASHHEPRSQSRRALRGERRQ